MAQYKTAAEYHEALMARPYGKVSVAEYEVLADMWESEGQLFESESVKEHAKLAVWNQARAVLSKLDPYFWHWDTVHKSRNSIKFRSTLAGYAHVDRLPAVPED